jgi:hypothetical protein
VLDSQLRLPVLALVVSADWGFLRLDSPHPTQAHQRDARCWRSASLADLVEQRSTVDKVGVAAEGQEARGLRWSLRTFCAGERR